MTRTTKLPDRSLPRIGGYLNSHKPSRRDGRLVWTRVHREFFRDNPKEFDFRPPGKIFIEEYAKFIASRNVLLGSAGQLDDLRKSLGK